MKLTMTAQWNIKKTGSIIVGGSNYGQGSSREHAAISPRYLGVKAVLTNGYARIHRKNLINFGILPLTFETEGDLDKIDQEDILEIQNVRDQVSKQEKIEVINKTKNQTYKTECPLSELELASILAGGLINIALEKHR